MSDVHWRIESTAEFDDIGNKSELPVVTNYERWFVCYSKEDAEWLLRRLEKADAFDDMDYRE